jgi:predicted nucleic acid-binding protein
MYLLDTNVISEARKGRRANAGVREFFGTLVEAGEPVFLSTITIGEIRRGVELVRYRGDGRQARRLDTWLTGVLRDYADSILPVDAEVAQLWGRLCVPSPHNALDKLIAATALVYDLVLVSRNSRHFDGLGLRLVNPFK